MSAHSAMCWFLYSLYEVMADGLSLQHSNHPPTSPTSFFSPLRSQGPAASGCLLHHLWLQSAQNSLVERGEGNKEQKKKKIHQESDIQGEKETRVEGEGTNGGERRTGQQTLTSEAL